LTTDVLEVVLRPLDLENENKADQRSPPDFDIFLLKGSMNEFLKKGKSRRKLMIEVLDFCHEEGMKAVDSFELEMIIFCLLNGSFLIMNNNSINIPKLPPKLK